MLNNMIISKDDYHDYQRPPSLNMESWLFLNFPEFVNVWFNPNLCKKKMFYFMWKNLPIFFTLNQLWTNKVTFTSSYLRANYSYHHDSSGAKPV